MHFFIKCLNSSEGFYFDEDALFYKPCYSSCKICDKKGNETYHNCIKCKDNYFSQLNFYNYTNCYNSCSNYQYYDTNTNSYHCTESLKCPSNYNKLIIDKNKCVEDCKLDEKYKYEYLNECYSICPNNSLNNSFICEPWKIK